MKDETNHNDEPYVVTEYEATAVAAKSEPMEEGECYDQDIPMHQEY